MSNRRTLETAGWAKLDAPRGPSGRRLCRWCRVEVPKGRRTFCSDGCVDKHLIRSNPGHARSRVWRRDQGVCALCRFDTKWIDQRISAAVAALKRRDGKTPARGPFGFCGVHWTIRQQMGIPSHRMTYWDMDHIKPVAEGGGECGLRNLRTLCIPCHKKETASLAGRRSKTRENRRCGT